MAQVFWTGWLAQFVFTLIGFNWVAYTVHEFGHLPWPLAILVLLGYGSIANLYLPLAGVAWAWTTRKLRLNLNGQLVALVIFVSLGERAFPMIFDWHFGYAWYWAKFPAYHLADIFGFIGLANIGLLFNALILKGFLSRPQSSRWWVWAASTAAVFLGLNLLGWVHAKGVQKPDANLKFLLVQADIDNQEKLASETGSAFRDVVISKWIQGSQLGLQSGPADYIVWPETAFPEVIDSSTLRGVYPMKLKAAILNGQTPLITGGYGVDAKTGRYTNSFFVINKDGNWIDSPYHKTVLLAFGEYFPFGDEFPFLKRMFPEVGDYGRGPGPSVLSGGNGVRLGAQICYEGLFDWFSRGLANKGAQLIVNLTNDAWYGSWMQPYQHSYMTFARAVEVRRPLIRSTNSGISGVALASGEILPLSPIYQVWTHTYDVPYAKQPRDTVFMGWGFWLIPGILLLAFLSLFWGGFRER